MITLKKDEGRSTRKGEGQHEPEAQDRAGIVAAVDKEDAAELVVVLRRRQVDARGAIARQAQLRAAPGEECSVRPGEALRKRSMGLRLTTVVAPRPDDIARPSRA